MPANTRALQVLRHAKVAFLAHEYRLGARPPEDTYGEAVAAALGQSPERLFKTLVAVVDATPVLAIVPTNARLSLKALARATGGKKAEMAAPADAERLTGYVTGGISPFGQRRRLPVFVDRSAEGFATVFVSGGRRGLQVEVAPADLVRLLDATAADLVTP
jgi:Cys-tRNA(Pro)/Cys-tRNA(Cys) deacylase